MNIKQIQTKFISMRKLLKEEILNKILLDAEIIGPINSEESLYLKIADIDENGCKFIAQNFSFEIYFSKNRTSKNIIEHNFILNPHSEDSSVGKNRILDINSEIAIIKNNLEITKKLCKSIQENMNFIEKRTFELFEEDIFLKKASFDVNRFYAKVTEINYDMLIKEGFKCSVGSYEEHLNYDAAFFFIDRKNKIDSFSSRAKKPISKKELYDYDMLSQTWSKQN